MHKIAIKKREIRGMTLIELIIVLGILAVVAGIATLHFQGTVDQTQLDEAAARLVTDLFLVQDQARRDQQECELVIEIAERSYNAADVPSLYGPQDIAVQLSDSPYHISSMEVSGFDGNIITFDARGIPASAGYITLRSGKRKSTVTVDERGHIEQIR
jgi:type II secretion system protein H